MEYISNDNRKFIFNFEINCEDKVVITAQEEHQNKIIPDIYKQEFTKDELSDKKKYDTSFDNFDEILRQINLSFQKKTAIINVNSSGLVLSYLLFNNLKVDLVIPLYTLSSTKSIDIYSTSFSHSKLFYLRYQKLLKYLIHLFKQNKDKNNIINKNVINELKKEIKGYFVEQREDIKSIKDILISKFNKENSIELQSSFTINNNSNNHGSKLLYKPIEDISKIKITHTIKDQHSSSINSICELKDKRLVSCSSDKSIIVYDKSYKPQIKIPNAHDSCIFSLCVLRNGELVSSSDDNKVKVWRINENDYQLIHTLIGHTRCVRKVIELKDGRISSCSYDHTIRIWDDYKCIQTLKGHTNDVGSIIEMNNYIISCSCDSTLRIWNESTYECIKIINSIHCEYWNGLSKMNDNTLLGAGYNVIYVVDIQTYKVVNKIEAQSSSIWIYCFNVLKNGLIIFGNQQGEICCTDISSDKIIFQNKLHNSCVCCLIESEDKLISCSSDNTINIYKEVA